METATAKEIQSVFKRKEKKYLLSRAQYETLFERLQEHMEPDVYGLSTVCSLYYDTPHWDLISRSIDKPIYKEKFRLRSYGVATDDSPVFAEIKKKYDGIVYKRRVTAPCGEMLRFLNEGVPLPDSPQIQQEIRWMLRRYDLRPAVWLAYDRIALVGREDPELRATFDFRVRYRTDRLDLREGDFGEELTGDDFYILETKIHKAAPLWLAQLFSELRIYPGTYSKYGTCYRERLLPSILADELEI